MSPDLTVIDARPIILPGGFGRLAMLVASVVIIRLMYGGVFALLASLVG